jgi:hypothetical protein
MQRVMSVCWLLGLVMVAAACGGAQVRADGAGRHKGDRSLVSQAEGVTPMWIQECPVRTDHVLPFCGEAVQLASQAGACAAAQAAALEKLRGFIGQQLGAGLEPEGGGKFSFRIPGAGDEPVRVTGVWEDSRWWEEYEGRSGRTFDCYVMLTYPAIEYHALVGQAQMAARQRLDKASQLHQEGQALLEDGVPRGALTRFERALGLLASLKERLHTQDGKNSELLHEQLQADLARARAEDAEASRTVVVALVMELDGKLETSGRVFERLESLVQQQILGKQLKVRPGGLPADQVAQVLKGDAKAAIQTAKDKSAGYLMVVKLQLNARRASDTPGVTYSFAEGALRLVSTVDGRELSTTSIRDKLGTPLSAEDTHAKMVESLCKGQLAKGLTSALGRI